MTTLSDDALRLAAEMRAGLEGVTPGPWSATALTTGIGANQDADGWETVAAIPCPRSPWGSARHRQWQRDAAHIARCDPSNIRLLLDTIDTLRRERDSITEAFNVGLNRAIATDATVERLKAEIARKDAALEECEEYFDNRADADCEGDPAEFVPNREMVLLTAVREALTTRSAIQPA